MGILKLIIAALVIGSIAVIINELHKRSKKAKIAKTLNEELDTVNDELLKADVEGDVLNAKTALKARRAELDKQIADLANGKLPTTGGVRKEGKQPAKSADKKKGGKKKTGAK